MPQDTEMNRSSLRTLMLHRSLVSRLNEETLSSWTPRILQNLERLNNSVQGHPHVENLNRWRHIVETHDVETLRTILNSDDPGSIEMREVSPMGGLISQEERLSILKFLPGEQAARQATSYEVARSQSSNRVGAVVKFPRGRRPPLPRAVKDAGTRRTFRRPPRRWAIARGQAPWSGVAILRTGIRL